MAGAHVFPGGLVEAADHDPRWRTAFDHHQDHHHHNLQEEEEEEEVALRVAGMREVFEESGVLITAPPMPASSQVMEAISPWRGRSAKDGGAFLQMFLQTPALRDHPYRPGTTLLEDEVGTQHSHETTSAAWDTRGGIPGSHSLARMQDSRCSCHGLTG